MLPTPDLSHLTAANYERVYEPAEDTFLLLDALEKDAAQLKDLAPALCLEIGSGTGCVSAFLGSILGSSSLYLCTDINLHACVCTVKTGTKNKIPLDPVNTVFALPFHSRLRHSVDVVLFNPPYVPTTDEESLDGQQSRNIPGAWAGGTHGMRVTDIFLDAVKDLLSSSGRFYLVAVKQNNVPEIQRRMSEEHQLCSEIVLHRRAGREHLFVLRFTRA